MAKIFAPNKAYNGETASVHFASGVGETEKFALLDWFREHGYTVEDTSTDPENEDDSTLEEREALSKRVFDLKLDLPDNWTYAQVLEAVEKAEQETKGPDDTEKEKKAAK